CAIWARRAALAPFLQTATVQTNETGRGLAWLLPLLYTGWEGAHLVDLGASAGLNLAADGRHYQLVAGDKTVLTMGTGQPVQFRSEIEGAFVPPNQRCCPGF
ncbi:MAG: DUF2332 family protein, partial [Anaerolineae bacterium]